MTTPLLQATGLTKRFGRGGEAVTAADAVSFSVAPGETLALVGPSGSGKSTIGRLLLRLVAPDAGSVRFQDEDWLALQGADLRRKRRFLQMVFQEPLAAFHPRSTVYSTISDPLRIHALVSRRDRRARAVDLMSAVELDAALLDRSVRDVSGGQRQRVAIARALACEPRLVVLDEPTSALDMGVRARILDLLARLQVERGLAYLFVSHDLLAVRRLAHRVAVMDAGRMVEDGPASEVLAAPRSAVAKALVAATPRLETEFPS